MLSSAFNKLETCLPGHMYHLKSRLAHVHTCHHLAPDSLYHAGSDAFMPGYYGPSIAIERKAGSSGSSVYTLYDHSGRKVGSPAVLQHVTTGRLPSGNP